MNAYDLKDESGRMFAFEVDVTLRGRRAVCSAIRAIPGVTVTKMPRLLSWLREETFCEFEVGGVAFQALEPFGDSSRYWIGPKDSPCWHPEIEVVRQAFSGEREK
jgi:hypothetical protein